MSGQDVMLLQIPLRADGDAVLRVGISEHRGKARIDVRTFYRFAGDAEHTATRRGITLTCDQARSVVEAVENAIGLISDEAPPRRPADTRKRRQGRRLSPDTRARVLALRSAGVPASEIAETLGVGIATVYRVVDQANKGGVGTRGEGATA